MTYKPGALVHPNLTPARDAWEPVGAKRGPAANDIEYVETGPLHHDGETDSNLVMLVGALIVLLVVLALAAAALAGAGYGAMTLFRYVITVWPEFVAYNLASPALLGLSLGALVVTVAGVCLNARLAALRAFRRLMEGK